MNIKKTSKEKKKEKKNALNSQYSAFVQVRTPFSKIQNKDDVNTHQRMSVFNQRSEFLVRDLRWRKIN